jgi:hypothetical protein
MLEARRAVFYNYHDPAVQLQKEDLDYYRYHPLLLNAAFLGNLTDSDRRILGFGNKHNFVSAFDRHAGTPLLYSLYSTAFNIGLHSKDLRERIGARVRRAFGR